MPRFRLTVLFAIVALVAFGCAALLYSNVLWRQITATAVLAVLTGAVLSAVALHDSPRWFWFGFAVTGWLYLALAFLGGERVRSMLLTQTALDGMHTSFGVGQPPLTPTGDRVEVEGNQVVVGPPGPYSAGGVIRTMSIEVAEAKGLLQHVDDPRNSPHPFEYFEIGHFLWALVLGSVAGAFTLWLRMDRQ